MQVLDLGVGLREMEGKRERGTNIREIQRQTDMIGKRDRQAYLLGADLVCELAVQVLDLDVGLRVTEGQRETQRQTDMEEETDIFTRG